MVSGNILPLNTKQAKDPIQTVLDKYTIKFFYELLEGDVRLIMAKLVRKIKFCRELSQIYGKNSRSEKFMNRDSLKVLTINSCPKRK